MLEQIILIFLKGIITPLILEIIKNKYNGGDKFLLACLRIAIAGFAGTFIAGFISVFVEIAFNIQEIALNSLLGSLLTMMSVIFVWLIVNKFI